MENIENNKEMNELVDCRKFWHHIIKIALAGSHLEVGTNNFTQTLD